MVGSVGTTFYHFDSPKSSLDFVLAACDVEGNFLVVKAYQYTDLLSCMLLSSWVSPPLDSDTTYESPHQLDGRSQRACSFHVYSCEPGTPGLSSLYAVQSPPLSFWF